jgi:hypothetical protein
VETIAQNEYYTMGVDRKKNRIYLIFSGYWKSPALVPNYVPDAKKALQMTSKGFTCLADVTKMKTPPDEIANLHIKMQSAYIQAGLRKTAEIVSSSVIKLLTSRLAQESGMLKKIFDNWDDAEAWLDDPH